MKKDFGTRVGSCAICDINLWDKYGGKPAIMPCGVKGCTYETSYKIERIEFSPMGNGLAQID